MSATIPVRHPKVSHHCTCSHPVHYGRPCEYGVFEGDRATICRCPSTCRRCHNAGFVIFRKYDPTEDEMVKEAADCPEPECAA